MPRDRRILRSRDYRTCQRRPHLSFGGIGMISSELAAGQLDLRYSYLVFNPGKKNHRHSEQVHGFSDLSLRFQDPSTPPRYGASSHPPSFSLPTTQRSTSEFINRELTLARLPTLIQPIYCTMKGYRGVRACRVRRPTWIKETRPKFNNGNAARSLHIWLAGCGTIARAFRGRRAPADPPAGARPTLVSF